MNGDTPAAQLALENLFREVLGFEPVDGENSTRELALESLDLQWQKDPLTWTQQLSYAVLDHDAACRNWLRLWNKLMRVVAPGEQTVHTSRIRRILLELACAASELIDTSARLAYVTAHWHQQYPFGLYSQIGSADLRLISQSDARLLKQITAQVDELLLGWCTIEARQDQMLCSSLVDITYAASGARQSVRSLKRLKPNPYSTDRLYQHMARLYLLASQIGPAALWIRSYHDLLALWR